MKKSLNAEKKKFALCSVKQHGGIHSATQRQEIRPSSEIKCQIPLCGIAKPNGGAFSTVGLHGGSKFEWWLRSWWCAKNASNQQNQDRDHRNRKKKNCVAAV